MSELNHTSTGTAPQVRALSQRKQPKMQSMRSLRAKPAPEPCSRLRGGLCASWASKDIIFSQRVMLIGGRNTLVRTYLHQLKLVLLTRRT